MIQFFNAFFVLDHLLRCFLLLRRSTRKVTQMILSNIIAYVNTVGNFYDQTNSVESYTY